MVKRWAHLRYHCNRWSIESLDWLLNYFILSQKATYLFVMDEFRYSKAQKSKVKRVAKDVVKSEVWSSDWRDLYTGRRWSVHLDRSSPDYCLLFYIWLSFCDINSDNLTWLGLSFVLFKGRNSSMSILDWQTGNNIFLCMLSLFQAYFFCSVYCHY